MKLVSLCAFLAVSALFGCAEANGGDLGTGGGPITAETSYLLRCKIGELVLEFPIELSYTVDPPYTEGASSDLVFTAALIFDEPTSTALSDAGVPKIDIISLDVTSGVLGATPSTVETSLASAPINDFDLDIDTNDNGIPGPHRLELESVSVASSVTQGADQVELSVSLDGLSMVLGETRVPTACIDPTLVGFSASFDVGP